MDRRRFLGLAAALPAALALPEALAAEGPWNADDLAVLRSVLRAVYGPGDSDAVEALSASFAYLDTDKQSLVGLLPTLFDHFSRVLVPTFVAFRELDPEAQARAVEDWATSPMPLRRQIFGALRQLLLAHAYADPQTWPSIGYPGPWLGRVELPVMPLRFGEVE